MKTIIQDKKFLAAVLLIVIGVIFRILQLVPNFSPMTAIALFGGAYLLDKRLSVFVTLASLFISDVLLAVMNHYAVFHDTILFIYGSYLLIVFLGWRLQKGNPSFIKIGGFAVLSSAIFFVISNFGVWLFGNIYPLNAGGLQLCFIRAIPFYNFTFLGDIVYTFIFFGLYRLIFSRAKDLSLQANSDYSKHLVEK